MWHPAEATHRRRRSAGRETAELGQILDCEIAFNAALADWRLLDRWNHAWADSAARWSEAVWRRAARLGPRPIDPADVAAGRRIAAAPVFVCGAPRSGTTLMRDLLDGHPALAVLPAEGKYFGEGEPAGENRAAAVARLGQEWLRRLANPNHQKPFWLLGRSGRDDGGYVAFARAYLGWEGALARCGVAHALHPAAALALATVRSHDLAAMRGWVDKTPGYEFHLERIWARFPRAKVIHVVRQPAAVAASYAAGLARTRLRSTPAARMLRNVASSHLAAWRAARTAPERQFLVVRYDKLVARRAEQMARVAGFLGLDWDDGLLRQTIAGHRAEPNSSFDGRPRAGFAPSGVDERLWLALAHAGWRLIASAGGCEP